MQIFPFTPLIWGLYSLAVVLLFTVIKLVNYRLHVMYDTGLAVEEPELEDMDNHDESQDHIDVNHGRSGETLGDANDGEHCRYLKCGNYV